jgi:hypothetical protein
LIFATNAIHFSLAHKRLLMLAEELKDSTKDMELINSCDCFVQALFVCTFLCA